MKTKYFLFLIGIFFSVAIQGQNSISLLNRPTSVVAGDSIDFTVNYSKVFSTAKVMVKFFDTNTNSQLNFDIVSNITANSGTLNFKVLAPSTVGTHYEIRAQLLEGWAGRADDNGSVSVVANIPPPTGNSITILNRPTSVVAGNNYTFNVSYSKDFPTARVLIKFYDTNSNSQLNFDVESSLTADSDVIPLTIQAPSNIGSNYEIHAQLLEGWAGRSSEIAGVTVTDESTPPTGENTLEIVNTSTNAINNGSIKRVNVQYNVLQASRILVEVRDSDVAAGSNKIGQVWVDVAAGSDIVGVDLVVNSGNPGSTNLIQAVLFEGNSWTPITIAEVPQILVNKGDGTITYRGQPYTGGNEQNTKFAESLGSGYYTNWFVNNGWKGDIQANFGSAEQAAWVDWDNNGFQSGQSHAEFDIKIQKYSWHNWKQPSVDRGYPTKIALLNNDVTCTANGQWASNSEGRTFLNMTAWLYNGGGDLNNNTYSKSDVIVHTWDNSGNLAQKYAANPNDNLEPLDTIHSGGVAYHVLKRNTGGYGEAATYNIVPYNNPRDGIWQTTFNTNPFSVSLNMKDILEKLISVDANSSIPVLDNQWYIHGLEWTFIGSSGDTVGGVFVQDSNAKLTLSSYTIPNLNGGSSLKSSKIKTTSVEELIYPNPFSDSFTYQYNAAEKEAVVLELYSMDGRRVKTVRNSNNDTNSITVNTGNLSKGMYVLRITSGDLTQTKKLIKN
ncbi:T9SS type A sorting domain-containing protein [Aureibaculum luteum]|uniref:T9SS type A sorting domain-containing protein n=1 Tax=Aureibaculum luteum TaxID=1548456 RepID=UPI000E51C67E|nr:T9SS type A sorting domain-containing protein [Aureibaculum luteum]